MMKKNLKFKITDKNVELYKQYKHELPCFKKLCFVAPMCFNEKKASGKAKHLRYTVTLKDPCSEAYSILRCIDGIPESIKMIQDGIDLVQIYTDNLANKLFVLNRK